MIPPRALTHPLRLALVLTAAVLAVGLMPSAAAHAEPSLAETERQVSALAQQMEIATEQYNEAREALNSTRARVAVLAKHAGPLRRQLAGYQVKLASSALAAYTNGRLGTAQALLTGGSPQSFLDEIRFLEQISDEQRNQVDAALRAKKKVDVALQPLIAALAKQARQEKALRDKKAQITKDLDKWEALRSKALGGGASRASGRVVASTYTGPAIGRARAALDFAYAQLGKPYVFAAAGPDAYDCSGLTMASWAQAGVSMAHGARAQYSAFPKVPFSDLHPGDLVFYGSPIHHVAMYIGNGKVIHAPQAGDVVRITSTTGPGNPVGAVRPG